MIPSQTTSRKRCPCKGDTLDKFVQPIILLILSKGSCSGYAIVKQMAHYPMLENNLPDTTGVYRQLKAMEQKGAITHVDYTDETGTEKKRYEITDEGRECLFNWSLTLMDYRTSITQLLDEIEEVIA